MKNKKGDNYTALIILITGVAIVLYILMLPASERAELLGENISSSGGSMPGQNNNDFSIIETLMVQTPGTLDYIDEDLMVIDIPSFNLFTKTSAEELANYDSIYVKKSVFSEDIRNINFSIDDLEFTDNIMLSFVASNRSGILTISLNGEPLLQKELETATPAPLTLPKPLLQEHNTITFEVSSPGVNFLKSNQYVLENLKIIADVTDISGQENKQYFVVSEDQMKFMEYATFSYIAECGVSESNPVEISLNKRSVFSGVPDCESKSEIRIDKEKFVEGENILWSKTDGNYRFYSVSFGLKLREIVYPTYYFTINNARFEKIEDGDAAVSLEIRFPNSVDEKHGRILVNDGIVEIETKEGEMARDISGSIVSGNNAIEIRPIESKLTISEIKVIYGE